MKYWVLFHSPVGLMHVYRIVTMRKRVKVSKSGDFKSWNLVA
jgi:hypothetical protein